MHFMETMNEKTYNRIIIFKYNTLKNVYVIQDGIKRRRI